MFFLINCKSSFCSRDIQMFVIFSRVASDFCNENSGTIQEHFKNISILFKNISDIESKIQERFMNKPLKTHHFKYFSRTTYNSRTIQGIQGI